jgi:selenocysteine-specific elongation factor
MKKLEARALRLVREFHESQPLLRGIPREELRSRVFADVHPEVFRHCLDSLAAAAKVSLQDDSVSLHGRVVQLSPDELLLKSRIDGIFRDKGFQPPLLTEIIEAVPAPADDVRRVYFWMLKEKLLVKLTDDLAYPRATLEEIKARIRSRYPSGARFGVSEFKELLDLTRKHAIPLLEYLDRDRFTRRQGNDRVLL